MFNNINFREPIIKKYPNKWYIEYYYRVPNELTEEFDYKEWRRFKVYERINSYNGKEQEAYANQLLKDVKEQLSLGFNPFAVNIVEKQTINYMEVKEIEKSLNKKEIENKEAETFNILKAKDEEEKAKSIEILKAKLEEYSKKQFKELETEIKSKQIVIPNFQPFKDLFERESDFDKVVKIMVDNDRMIIDNSKGVISFIPIRRSCKYEIESFRQALGFKGLLKPKLLKNRELVDIYKKSFNIEMNEKTLRNNSIADIAKIYFKMLSTLS